MNLSRFINFQNLSNFKKIPLKFLELIFLSLLFLSLPSLEGPKNIFLILFILIAIWNQYSIKNQLTLNKWDLMYVGLSISAFLSVLFAGLPQYEEWRGFRGIFAWTLFGLVLSRSSYNEKEISWLYLLIILSTLPALMWGIVEYLIIHTKNDLQLHSVGHVNHSAIYLAMIFGATFSLFFFNSKKSLLHNLFFLSLILLFFFGLIIGRSRGAFGIATILSFTLIYLLHAEMKVKKVLGFFLSVFLIFAIISNANIFQKITNSYKTHDNLAARDRVWNISLEAFRLYPIFGVGNANFKYLDAFKIKPAVESRGEVFDSARYHFAGHSHNIYLSALAERGLVGFIVLLNFMLTWFFLLIKTYKKIKLNHLSQMLWGGSLSAFIVTFGTGLVNSTLHHEHALLAFIFLSLHLNYLRKNNQI
jgi:O-antigen ligase